MVDLTQRESSSFSKITNENEDLTVDVINEQALKRLATTTYVTGGDIKVNPQGLKGSWRVTTMLIPDTATLIAPTPLADRNHLSLLNKDGSKTLYLGPTSGVTANTVVGTTSGWEVTAGSSFNIDLKDTINVYAIAPAGQTILVKIIEAV